MWKSGKIETSVECRSVGNTKGLLLSRYANFHFINFYVKSVFFNESNFTKD